MVRITNRSGSLKNMTYIYVMPLSEDYNGNGFLENGG